MKKIFGSNYQNRISPILFITAFILLIPFTAMQFTNEVNWSIGDFIFAAVLLISFGLLYEFLAKRNQSIIYKTAFGITLFSAFILIWANLAVGIIGSEDNPANLMYIAVLATLFLGSIITRFKPLGMSYTLFSTALVHFIITIIALTTDFGTTNNEVQVLLINGFFIMLWVLSGLLFRNFKAVMVAS